MARRSAALSLVLLAVLVWGEIGVCQNANRVNSFGQSIEELLESARMVSNLLEAAHPAHPPGGQGLRSRRPVRSAEQAAANSALTEALDNAALPQQLQFSEFADKHTPLSCRSCYITAHNVIKRIRESDDRDDIVEVSVDFCVRLNVSSPDVCQGLGETNVDALMYVLNASPEIDTVKVCSNILPECDDGRPALTWPLKEPLGEKPPVKPQPFITNLLMTSKPKPIRILQITDFHFDSKYKEGSNYDCGLPLCCRSDRNQGDTSIPDGAGRWGDYRRCDIPWETVVEFCTHVSETHKIDMLYFTGDIIDHAVWETSREGNVKMIRKVFESFRKTFGKKVRIFPIVGNHEPHPANLFVPGDANVSESIGSRWLYEALADEWSYWLPADTRETIMQGGFYTVRVNENFRIVALNTMFCYNLNWWMMYDPVDPAGQLSWLVKVLKAAESAGEKVHILSHIPPGGDDCLHTWSEHYWRIVKRFSDTIVGQFNGHSHIDEMRIFYTDDGKGNAWAFNSAFNGGSLTTYADVNPNYKIYEVDGSGKDASWQVRNSEVWGFNLTDANSQHLERPHWFKVYSFAEKYNVPSMHVSHLDTLVRRFASDKETRDIYWRPKVDQTKYRYDLKSFFSVDSDPGKRTPL